MGFQKYTKVGAYVAYAGLPTAVFSIFLKQIYINGNIVSETWKYWSTESCKAVLKALSVDFISKEEKKYNPEFVKKIQESRKQVKEGKVTTIKLEDLWK